MVTDTNTINTGNPVLLQFTWLNNKSFSQILNIVIICVSNNAMFLSLTTNSKSLFTDMTVGISMHPDMFFFPHLNGPYVLR